MKRSIGAFTLAFCLTLAPLSGHAMLADEDALSVDAIAIPKAEMAKLRGGFMDPSGFIYSFAVDIRTQVDGALTFVRSITLDSMRGGSFQATSNTELLTQNLPENTNANLINNGTGFVVDGSNGGSTTVLTETPGGAPSSIVINTADNRNIVQTLNIDLTLQSMQTIVGQNGLLNGGAMSGMMQSMNLKTLGFGL